MLAAKRRRASAKTSFQQITGHRPVASYRQEWRRFDLHSALVTTALGTGVLAAASLWPANGAIAGCIEYDPTGTPNTVLCDTNVTTIDSSIESTIAVTSNIRHQVFGGVEADPDNVVVTITDQGIIDGNGLAVSSFEAGASITVDHQGAISIDGGNNPTDGGNAVFNLTTNNGDVIYTGNGSVIDYDGGNAGLVIETNGGDIFIGTAGSPVTPNYQGTDALLTDSDAGDQHVFLDGGSLVGDP